MLGLKKEKRKGGGSVLLFFSRGGELYCLLWRKGEGGKIYISSIIRKGKEKGKKKKKVAAYAITPI